MAAKSKSKPRQARAKGPDQLPGYKPQKGQAMEKLTCTDCHDPFMFPKRSRPGHVRHRCRNCHWEAYHAGNRLLPKYKAKVEAKRGAKNKAVRDIVMEALGTPDPTARTKSGLPKRSTPISRKSSSTRKTATNNRRKSAAA